MGYRHRPDRPVDERRAMSFEPQKFFIGVMDFFSILLPGGILTWLMKDAVVAALGGSGSPVRLDAPEAWVAFGVVSYLVGHLLFLLGSWLDGVYDALRRRTVNRQLDRVLRGEKVSPRLVRLLVWLVFKRERDLAVTRAGAIKAAALGPLGAADAVNAFQWSKAFLDAESPSALSAVQRLEADSKFFRCFTVLLLVLLVTWWWWQPRPFVALAIVVILLPLSFWRFMDQRFKATNQAYWFVITISARSAPRPRQGVAGDPVEARAGGVVYRIRRGRAEYLVVEATEHRERWVLPKGHVDSGEDARRTAVREVHEETGVWGRPEEDLGTVSWPEGDGAAQTHFFLMRRIAKGLADENRAHRWLALDPACAAAAYEETAALLERADARRQAAAPAAA